MKMTTEEAFVKVLQMHGIEHSFGIIGSAFMPISDLFPQAGITFWDVAHETNGGLICDGYTRATGKMGMAIAQNGPGVTGFVTAMKTAYWNHTPMLLVTPQAANKTIGQGGFQEVEQMAMFRDMVCYQEEVRDASRIAEVLNRVILKAWRGSAPAQINVPRDLWTQVIDIELPQMVRFERSAGGKRAIANAAALLSEARFPVILNGAGVILGDGIAASQALAERLSAPVCCNYQHNDAFPGSHPLACGPLGYNGSKAAMELIARADVVLALGTRLNPFSTLPGYGIDYWPTEAKIIQVDINADRIGLTKKVSVGIEGDARQVAEQILEQLSKKAGDAGRAEREALIQKTKADWQTQLATMDHEDDDPGTSWNERARDRDSDRMSPRQAWRAIMEALPKDAIISSDIGNNCAIGNAYPAFEQSRKYLAPGLFGPCGYGFPSIIGAKIGCPDVPVVGFAGDGAFGISMSEMSSIGRENWPAITMIIFRNYQWGAEKRNTTLWYDDNFVGTELDPQVSYARVAEGCGLKGVTVQTSAEMSEALRIACKEQAGGVTTFLEVILNQELGEPFRRDAMKKPTVVAGIDRSDMRPPEVTFEISYAELPDEFYARVAPTPVAAPKLLRLNVPLAQELGLAPEELTSPNGVALLAGNRGFEDVHPIAMAYAGHQFGNWVPSLGDGRALLLGEVVDRRGRRRDIQLKGAGPTPFSRRGDGRAALGPVLREYVLSEAMHALGIPTTRALAMVTTGESVVRERAEPGAILTRVASGHIRVGTFQYFYARGMTDSVRALADYVIERGFPDAAGAPNRYRALLDQVIERQADLIARWLLVGFIHGVMNTDNMSIFGETIDFGPCAFLDEYEPGKVYSSIDQHGRYAYNQQPSIGLWNLTRFAETLLPLLADDEAAAVESAQSALAGYQARFRLSYDAGLCRKIGLVDPSEANLELASGLLEIMAAARADFTLTFRRLCELGSSEAEAEAAARAGFDEPAAFDAWVRNWRASLAQEGRDAATRQAEMQATNPAFIPRNHRVQQAIDAAIDEGDLGPLDALSTVTTQPFEPHPTLAAYAEPPEPHEVVHATFCGT